MRVALAPLAMVALLSVLCAGGDARAQHPSPPAAPLPASISPRAPAAPEIDGSGAVSPPQHPTRVEVGLYLLALTRVSPPAEAFPTFQAEAFLDVRWHDPRLAYDAQGAPGARRVFQGEHAARALAAIWWPDLEIENAEGERRTESRDLIVLPDGSVEYTERFQATLRAPFDLRRFPFDHQSLPIVVEAAGWDAREVVLSPLPARTGFGLERTSPEWTVERATSASALHREVRSDESFSRLVLTIEAQRNPRFYLWKILVPLLLIVAFGWSTFWMTGEAAPTRLQRGFVTLLSIVAFHHVAAQHLPRIPYLTFLDGMVFTAFAFVAGAIVQIIWTFHAEQRGRRDAIVRVDRLARWLYPTLLAAVLAALWVVYHR